jgi:hypothetical protein
MAVSEVQIAKLALQHIGDRFDITSLSEASTEAEQINLVFDNVRDQLIRQHPWKFSLRYYTPSALGGTAPAGWARMYVYPADALKVWRIVNPLDPDGSNLPPLKWSVARNNDDVKVLLTNESEPEFEYSKLVTNSLEFDASFDWALSWKLAAVIAMPITGDLAVRDRVMQDAERQIELAKREDGNEGVSREQSRDPDWLRARL